MVPKAPEHGSVGDDPRERSPHPLRSVRPERPKGGDDDVGGRSGSGGKAGGSDCRADLAGVVEPARQCRDDRAFGREARVHEIGTIRDADDAMPEGAELDARAAMGGGGASTIEDPWSESGWALSLTLPPLGVLILKPEPMPPEEERRGLPG